MKAVIRLGDPTSHGGIVLSAAASTTLFGKPVACVGDRVSCPKSGHDNCIIVEGDEGWTIDGRAVALAGHRTSCGAVLIATLGEVMRDPNGGAAAAPVAAVISMAGAATRAAGEGHRYDLHFQLLGDQTGQPLANVPYKLTLADGTEVLGHTDSHGHTEKITSDHPAIATLIAPYYAFNDTEDTDADDGCCSCHSEAA